MSQIVEKRVALRRVKEREDAAFLRILEQERSRRDGPSQQQQQQEAAGGWGWLGSVGGGWFY